VEIISIDNVIRSGRMVLKYYKNIHRNDKNTLKIIKLLSHIKNDHFKIKIKKHYFKLKKNTVTT